MAISIRKIKQHNPQQFLDDLKRCREVVVLASYSREYFKTTKAEVLKAAERGRINYCVSDKIYVVKRNTFVIT